MPGFYSQFTPDQLRAGFRRNAASLRIMLTQAEVRSPKRYRGFTAAELRDSAQRYTHLSTASDTEIQAHIEGHTRPYAVPAPCVS